jgi:pimeloyl-ACP methyl ester carboxylesterase
VDLEGGWMELSLQAAEDLGSFFPLPDPPPLIAARRRGELPGGWIEDLRFSSADYAPWRESSRQALERFPRNRTAHARHLRHEAPGHPALLWLHGWGMGGSYALEARLCRARRLFELGLDVYLCVQPFHGPRLPRGVLFAGELYPSTDVGLTNEGMMQTAWELRALMARHRRICGGRAGVMGLSLGGYVAAVMATVAPELAFAICLLPVADVPALMWSNGQDTEHRRRAEREGVVFDDFCQSMALHAPLAHPPALPPERLLLVGARGDRIIPPAHTRALWEHWGRPRLHWYPGGHVTHFGRGGGEGYLLAVESFLQEQMERQRWTSSRQ